MCLNVLKKNYIYFLLKYLKTYVISTTGQPSNSTIPANPVLEALEKYSDHYEKKMSMICGSSRCSSLTYDKVKCTSFIKMHICK